MKQIASTLNMAFFLILSLSLSACGGGGGGGGGSSSKPTTGEVPVETFSITATATPSLGGSVTGGGEYNKGKKFTLEATPNEGYAFIKWTENETAIPGQERAPILEANATKDRSFTAHFTDHFIKELKLSPTNSQIPLGTELIMSAQAVYNDGSAEDVTQSVTWTSSDTEKATFESDRPNVVKSIGLGEVSITATVDGEKSATTVTISSAELLSLALSNDQFDLALGETNAIQVDGTYRGGVVINVTKDVIWTSGNEGIATVSNEEASAGLIEGKAVGSTTISASLDGKKSPNATVDVSDAAISYLKIFVDDTSIPEGALAKLTAFTIYTDKSSKDVTEQVTWQSDDPSIAKVSDATSTKGFLSAKSAGSARISAQIGEFPADTSLTIVAAPNKPGALTLQAMPNVILNDGSDKSVVTTTVLPNDRTNGVIVDGTVVDFTQSDSSLTLIPLQNSTVSGKVAKEAVSSTAGRYKLIAEVPDTVAIDDVEISVVSSFSDVVGTSGSLAVTSKNGYIDIEAGGKFIATITNTSNRVFNVKKALLFNGSSEVASINDLAKLGGGVLNAGESISVSFTLSQNLPNDGFRIKFELADTPTATEFTVQKSWKI